MFGAAALMLAAMAGDLSPAQSFDPRAEEVIARSRASQSTYTMYWRTYASGPATEPSFAWAATFRRGPLVRAEDGNSRAVGDCAAGTATQFNLSVGRDQYAIGKKIVKRYCGVDSVLKILSTLWLGKKESRFGPIDEVRITDRDGSYVYQVTKAGDIVGSSKTYRGSNVIVVTEPMSFHPTVPEGDLFSRKSLATSKVPKVIQSRGSRGDR